MPREKLDRHLDFIRSLPCLCCCDNTATEAAHIRMSDARIAKVNAGVGQKPDDFFCVPLCGRHHREQHSGSELKFWQRFGVDPILYALRLWSVTGNHEVGCEVVEAACGNARPLNFLVAG
jgi:hypothetical protein